MRLSNEQRGVLLERWLTEKRVQFNHGRSGWQKVSCYGAGHYHGDRNPSATINLSTGYYKCFACDLEGDALALVMDEEGLDFKGALDYFGAEGKTIEEPKWI